jgi:Leucine-rich repeat (LRR) protein
VYGTRIDDTGLIFLEGLPKLKRLNLDKCNVGDKGMKSVGKLTNLEYLHIGSTQVTDDGLKELHGLKNLKEIVLTFASGVSDTGVEELQAALPQLETIDR